MPLSLRGWGLQEELLSPRILYWCHQRAYWSCCEQQHIETPQIPPRVQHSLLTGPPQRFISLCFKGEFQLAQKEWMSVVAAYTRRDLHEPKDRFEAISGLATYYLDAFPFINAASEPEIYLAGLWKGGIPMQLAWSVAKCTSRPTLKQFAPLWSWASLPLRTDITFLEDFVPTPFFKLLASDYVNETGDSHARVRAGASVKSLEVQGRLRKLVKPESQELSWNDIHHVRSGEQYFDFTGFLDVNGHAVDAANGVFLVHEIRKEEVVGQLDYLPAKGQGSETSLDKLYCMEVGKSAMLILKRRSDGDYEQYQRVGMAVQYRKDFFAGALVRKLVLT